MSSKYVGVSFNKSSPIHWRTQGCLHGKTFHLGYHPTEIAAAQAYDRWAWKNDFKQLNFPANVKKRATGRGAKQ